MVDEQIEEQLDLYRDALTTVEKAQDFSGFVQTGCYPAQPQPCPSCGRCPTCGRGGYQTYPIYPSPWWQIGPIYCTDGFGGVTTTTTSGGC